MVEEENIKGDKTLVSTMVDRDCLKFVLYRFASDLFCVLCLTDRGF